MTHIDVVDDESLRRFLCGLADESEREEIERMLLADEAIEDRLAALDEELARDYLRGALKGDAAAAFKACIAESPARMARVNQTGELMLALESLQGLPVHPTQPRVVAWRSWTSWAAAGAAAVVLLSVWVLRPGTPATPPSAVSPSTAADVEATFRLGGGGTRSTETAQNVLRPVPEVTVVRFQGEITSPTSDGGSIRGVLRGVGSAPVPVESQPQIRRNGDKTEIDWIIPRRLLAPGDYILSVRVERADSSEDLGSWFFSVLEPIRRSR